MHNGFRDYFDFFSNGEVSNWYEMSEVKSSKDLLLVSILDFIHKARIYYTH